MPQESQYVSTDPNFGTPMRGQAANKPTPSRDQVAEYIGATIENIPGSAKTLAANLLAALAEGSRKTLDLRGTSQPGRPSLPERAPIFDVIDHYVNRYGSADARERTVRDDPVGMAFDMMPVAKGAQMVPAAARKAVSAARSGVVGAADLVAQHPTAVSTTLGAVPGAMSGNLPVAMGGAALGFERGPALGRRAQRFADRMRGAASAAPAAPSAAAAPVSPVASSPAAPAPSAAPSVPAAAPAPTVGSAPSRPPVQVKVLPGETLTLPPSARTAAQMSPAAIQNDLALANRRLGANLTQPQYAAATDFVRQGMSPAEAVAEVAARTVAPATATPTAAAAPATPPATPAKGKTPKRARLTPDEADEYLRLTGKGMTNEEAVAALMDQRKLAKTLGTPSAESARRRVAERNATGRWPTSED